MCGLFGWFKQDESLFSLSLGTKVVLGLFGCSMILFGAGYALQSADDFLDDFEENTNENEK